MPATLFKSFQYGNGSYVNLLKFVKSRQVNLFSAGSFGTMCDGFILKQRSWIHPGATIFLISDSR